MVPAAHACQGGYGVVAIRGGHLLLEEPRPLLELLEEEEEELLLLLPEASCPAAAASAAAPARSGRGPSSTRSSLALILGRPRLACRHACMTTQTLAA